MIPSGLPFSLSVHTPPPESQTTASLQEALSSKTAMLPPNTVNAAGCQIVRAQHPDPVRP
ncbi:hypothetical protein MY5147_009492, partial [Beauveria neobassiana]